MFGNAVPAGGIDFRSLIMAVTGSWIALLCHRSFAMRGMA
jgi:hypothetical protein